MMLAGALIPTNSTPISTDGTPRGTRLNSRRPTSVATLAACTSTGRVKSTATSPSLIRSAISVRPERLTEPRIPWESQM